MTKEIIKRTDRQPFFEPIGSKIAGGLHSEVFELGEDWVVKTIKPIWQRNGWEEKIIDDLHFLQKYLGDFIPFTAVVKGADTIGKKPKLMFVQKRIKEARPLRDFSWEELMAVPLIKNQFTDFTARVCKMHEETGRTPDLHGNNGARQYDFKYSDNVLIDKSGAIWFVDVDMMEPLWSSNWAGGKAHMRKMMASLINFTARVASAKVSP